MISRIGNLAAQIQELRDGQRLQNRLLRQIANGMSTPLGGGRVLTRMCTGQEMFIDNRDTGSGLNIIQSGRIEPNVLRFIQKFLLPGTVFLDVGANFGFYSIFAGSQMSRSGRIYAFEANPFLKDFLASSAYINGLPDRIAIVNKAVSDHVGTAQFGFSFSGIGGGSLDKGAESSQGLETISVPLTTIDCEVDPDLKVTCVKIDVEGAEVSALRGMTGVIARSPDAVLILEFFPNLQRADSGAGLLSQLESMGLKYWRINDRGRLDDISKQDLINGGDCYLASSRTRPDDRALRLEASALNIVGARDAEGFLVGKAGATLSHGPYWFLQSGNYEVRIVGEQHGEIEAAFSHEFGYNIKRAKLSPANKSFTVDLPEDTRYFEVVLRSAGDQTRLKLERVEVIERY